MLKRSIFKVFWILALLSILSSLFMWATELPFKLTTGTVAIICLALYRGVKQSRNIFDKALLFILTLALFGDCVLVINKLYLAPTANPLGFLFFLFGLVSYLIAYTTLGITLQKLVEHRGRLSWFSLVAVSLLSIAFYLYLNPPAEMRIPVILYLGQATFLFFSSVCVWEGATGLKRDVRTILLSVGPLLYLSDLVIGFQLFYSGIKPVLLLEGIITSTYYLGLGGIIHSYPKMKKFPLVQERLFKTPQRTGV